MKVASRSGVRGLVRKARGAGPLPCRRASRSLRFEPLEGRCLLNVAPTLANVAVTPTINEGESAHLTGEIHDPDALDSLTLTVDWGDGNSPESFAFGPGTTCFDVSHLYLDNRPGNAPYALSVSVADDHGGVGELPLYNPVKVKNVFPLLGMPDWWVGVDDTLFFGATEFSGDGIGDSNYELWKSDGTEAGTVLVKDILPGPDGSVPMALTNVDGRLFFVATDLEHGRELWTSDGTEAGTHVLDVSPGVAAQDPNMMHLTASNGLLFFALPDAALGGHNLWKSDGTEAGTTMVTADVQPFAAGSVSGGRPFSWATLGGDLFFPGTDVHGDQGVELWKTDGTAAGTVLVKEIAAGADSSMPISLVNVDGRLFFLASDPEHGTELWTSDGTEAGTQVMDLTPGPADSTLLPLIIGANGLAFFAMADPATGAYSLWKSDGTPAGTGMISDVVPMFSDWPFVPVAAGDTLFFAGCDAAGAQGNELWKSDGTPAGTTLVKDIVSGPDGSLPMWLVPAGDRVFFAIIDPESDMELWGSDGTEAGTQMVNLAANPCPWPFTAVGEDFYFAALDPSDPSYHVHALWKVGSAAEPLQVVVNNVPPEVHIVYGADPMDPNFGVSGKVTTDFIGSADNPATDVVVQADGNLVALGYANGAFALARYLPDGSLDPTFGDAGKVVTALAESAQAHAAAVDAAGRIVVAGYDSGLVVARYLPDGSLDASFGAAGISRFELSGDDQAYAVAIQTDGKILVGGMASRDATGQDFVLLRLGQDGALDAGFGDAGRVWVDFDGRTDCVHDMLIDPSGRIVLAGDSYTYQGSAVSLFALARVNPDGSLDDGSLSDSTPGDSFGVGGKTTTAIGWGVAYSVALAPDNKLVVAGQASLYSGQTGDFAVARYNADGSLDDGSAADSTPGDSFGAVGWVVHDFGSNGGEGATGVAIQSDGKIAVAGIAAGVIHPDSSMHSDFALTRFNADGSLDESFGAQGEVLTDFAGYNDEPAAMLLDAAGRLVVAGFTDPTGSGGGYDFGLARYNSDGSLDAGFGGDGRVTTDMPGSASDTAMAVAVLADGRIVTAGASGSGGVAYCALARYNPDGSLDASFGDGGQVLALLEAAGGGAMAVAVQSDGKTVVAGSSTNAWFVVARFDANGELDTTFGSGGVVTTAFGTMGAQVYAVAIQSDGKIVVSGQCVGEETGYETAMALARYNSDGSLDQDFGNGGRVVTTVGPNGGYAPGVAIQPDGKIVLGGTRAVVRYNSDGSLDEDFGTGGKVLLDLAADLRGIGIQPDGKIVAAGMAFEPGLMGIGLLRLNPDGTPDAAFGTDGWLVSDYGNGSFWNVVGGMAIRPDGKIVVAGTTFNMLTGTDYGVACFDADGAPDESFGAGGNFTADMGSPSDFAFAVALSPDGNIVAAGYTHNAATDLDFAVLCCRSGVPLVEGTPLTLASQVTDPGAVDTFTYDWQVVKDDAVVATGNGPTFNFTPGDDGTYTVTLTVTDQDGGVGSDVRVLTVNNVAPTITSISSSSAGFGGAAQGQDVNVSAAFVDPGLLDTHSAVIDWGDGTVTAATIAETAGLGTAVGSHAYAQAGFYTVTVTVTDDDGGATVATTTAVVAGIGVHDGVLQVIGTNADDHLHIVPSGCHRLRLYADFLPGGCQSVAVAGVSRIAVLLGGGDDRVNIADCVRIAVLVDGGSGDDWLSGGGGPNILLGGDGDDVLNAGSHRDVLIGGAGRDRLIGHCGGDLLIAGRTSLDLDYSALGADFDSALMAVLAEWNSELPYHVRVGRLQGMFTALDDDAKDTLFGGCGRDCFFANVQGGVLDRIMDLRCGELIVEL